MRLRFALILCLICQCCLAQHWQALGSGLRSFGNTTYMYSDSAFDLLYAAGPFTRVDGDTVWGIASWNGTNWDSLGNGIDNDGMSGIPGNTWGMTHYGGYLYVGGNFRYTGFASCKALSRWDGTNWSTIPGGQPNNTVHDVIVYNNELYICGVFDSVGSTPADRIAKFDGTTWQCIGNNYDFGNNMAAIQRMTVYHGNLYIGGIFYDPQGAPCRLAKWDGTNWEFMTGALVGGMADVHDMIVYNDELYVSGLFYASAGNAGNCIMRWNDTTWRDVGGSVEFYSFNTPQVRNMKVHNGKLYCAGSFEKIGGIMAMGLASWDGTDWCGYSTTFLINGQETGLMNLEFYDDTLYVSGSFVTANGDTMNSIAKWIGGNYVDVCGNTTGYSELLHESSVSVFPNPASDVVTFQFENNEQRTIIVYDAVGREVWRKQTSELLVEFPACEFAGGMYFYSVIEDRAVVTGRILLEH